MPIVKSKRHSKYIGLFGEALVSNMLSRSGFEVMHVDHVGIDVVAARDDVGRIGISVKSRTREKKEDELSSVNLFSASNTSLEKACEDFGLEPWVAVYVETETGADLYLTSFQNFRTKYAGERLATLRWRMREQDKGSYGADSQVMHLHIEFSQNKWFPTPARAGR